MDRRPFLVAAAGGVALAVALTGCSVLRGGDDPVPRPSRAAQTSAPGPIADPTVQAVSMDPPSIAVGTVLTETDVTSPSGRTSIHVRVVVADNGTFRTELSGYRSTEAQAMTLEFRRTVPKPTDGPGHDYGQVQWQADAQPPASSPLDDVGARPDFLESVVLIPTVTTDANGTVDAPEWAGHVLAVAPLTWHVPNPYPDLTVTMGAARPGAYGVVTTTDSRKADYLVSHGDDQITVAKRFGITVAELRWMNPDMQVATNGWLTEYDHLNLDPSAR